MTKLTKTQNDLLIAAQADEGVPTPTDPTPAGLIKLGLLTSIPRVGEVSRLLITSKGKALLERADDKPSAERGGGELTGEGAEGDAPKAPANPKGKIGSLVALLRRPEGAGLQEMQDATGWQAHSVRGAIAGSVKKKLGLTVTSEKTTAGRVYRIVEGVGA
jgi:hypothetical protein